VDLTRLVGGHVLVEGPRDDGEGGVLFSDVVSGGVFRWTGGKRATAVLEGRRGIGGLVPHAKGGLVVTGRDVTVVGGRGDDRELLGLRGGMKGFNDLVTMDDGSLLVGALRFRPMAGEEPVPGEVWRVPPRRGGEPEVLLEGVVWPNGIGLTPDGGTIYVADVQTSEVLACAPDGSDRRVFAQVPDGAPDGLAVDADGDVWVALGPGGGIARFTPAGELRERIDVPGSDFVSSVAFAGDDDLLVATAGALLRAQGVGVRGRAVPPCSS
jgi:sugar lactone lactonase YvrE